MGLIASNSLVRVSDRPVVSGAHRCETIAPITQIAPPIITLGPMPIFEIPTGSRNVPELGAAGRGRNRRAKRRRWA